MWPIPGGGDAQIYCVRRVGESNAGAFAVLGLYSRPLLAAAKSAWKLA
jgi:hypothetical protein